jgi:hypothetical protein
MPLGFVHEFLYGIVHERLHECVHVDEHVPNVRIRWAKLAPGVGPRRYKVLHPRPIVSSREHCRLPQECCVDPTLSFKCDPVRVGGWHEANVLPDISKL